RSPASLPGLGTLAYWVTRGRRGALMGGPLPERGAAPAKVIARGTFAELSLVPDSRGYGLVWSDGEGGYIGRPTHAGQRGCAAPLDPSRGRFRRGTVVGTDKGYVAVWLPPGAASAGGGQGYDADSSPHVFGQVFDAEGRAFGQAVQLVNA